jgi:hypothetical protein
MGLNGFEVQRSGDSDRRLSISYDVGLDKILAKIKLPTSNSGLDADYLYRNGNNVCIV